MSVATNPQEENARRFLGIAATLGVVGIAFNLDGDGTLPKLLVAGALVALVWSIHRFGRLGPDAPIVFSVAEPTDAPKKKKKKKKRAEPAPDAPEGESNDGM